MSQEKYIDGIDAASKAGDIVYHLDSVQGAYGIYGPFDSFSHFPEKDSGMLRESNTRSIEPLGRSMFQMHSEIHKILILGPGGGKELTDARALAPNAHITSISYSPVNPAAHILEVARNIEASMNAALGTRRIDSFVPDELLQAKLGKPIIKLNVANPVVNKQHIGNLFEIAPHLEPKTTDIIYENLGSLRYAFNTKTEPREGLDTMRHVIKSLSPNGALVSMDTSFYVRTLLATLKGKHDHVIHINNSGPSMYVKPDHPIARRLAKRTSIPTIMNSHQAEMMLGIKMD